MAMQDDIGSQSGASRSERLRLYSELMDQRSLEGISNAKALDHVVRLRELAYELRDTEGLKLAISLADEIEARGLQPREESKLNYFLSNAWEKMRLLKAEAGQSVWAWEQPEIEKELVHLRRTLHREALKDISTRQISTVLSNMAALMNHVGRFSEAQEYWDRSVSLMPSHTLAKGKRGYALTHYAHVIYDRGQADKFMKKARGDLFSAANVAETSTTERLPTEMRGYFMKRLQWLDAAHPTAGKSRDLALFKYAEGTSREEVTYRRWCLENRLFLNPLNDLGPYPAAMRDVLAVPPVVSAAPGKGRPMYHGLYNQMKQTYVSSRYLYYEGVTADSTHFSDKDVLLFDTMDYPSYSLSIEKVKASFRMAYGIFDKIAYFLNEYMDLGLPEHRLTFRSFWYRAQDRAQGLHEVFADRKNWALRGLFWISKDLYEEQSGFTECLEPDAQDMAAARAGIERKYLKIHEGQIEPGMRAGIYADTMAMSMGRAEFEARTLRLLKKARTALMNLCFAVHYEEKLRLAAATGGNTEALMLPALTLSVIDDSWKV